MSQNEVSTFIERAINLRKEGRVDQALLAARKAFSLDSEDPSAWWQLGHSHKEKKGDVSARAAFEKVTELAPDFANGWYQYGRHSTVRGILTRRSIPRACAGVRRRAFRKHANACVRARATRRGRPGSA